MTRIHANPELLTWVRERAGLDAIALAGRFPKLAESEAGGLQPTLRQLEDFARAVPVAVGCRINATRLRQWAQLGPGTEPLRAAKGLSQNPIHDKPQDLGGWTLRLRAG